MLNELLPQIRKERGRAIIVDLTGSFIDRFFDPKCDKLLNPCKRILQHGYRGMIVMKFGIIMIWQVF